MRLLALMIVAMGMGGLTAQPVLSFAQVDGGEKRYLSSWVALGEGRIAAIAVVGADPTTARIGEGSEGAALELVVHDPASRLAILKLPAEVEPGTAPKRGSSLALQVADEVYLDAGRKDQVSRVVTWQNSHRDKVLPLALMLVHHSGKAAPLPGTGLYNEKGDLVAICHQKAPTFGNGNYALPVEVIERTEKEHRLRGSLARCWIGITMEHNNPVPVIESVRPDSPVAKAGLKRGDILLSVGPYRIETYADAVNAFYYLISGVPTSIKALRGTELLESTVVPGVHPASLEGATDE